MKNVISLFAVIIILGALVISCGSSPSTPEDVAKEFMSRVEKGSSSALDLFSPELVQMIGKEKLQKAIEEQSAEIKKKGGIKSVEVTDLKIEGEEATMNVVTNFNDGSSETEDMKMIKKDGDWLITISK
ncbi:MAG: DUF4878 domain-containing protein [Ignavibacterium sp.]|nr:DUF4878 domain-containing protein [Ignavibacterium sp.]